MTTTDTLLTLMLYGCSAVLVAGALYVIIELVAFNLRSRKRELAAGDPPTTEELAEIEELRRPGVLNLGGRESAAARHFEAPVRQNPLSRFGGGSTVDSPQSSAVIRRWRDDRTEG